jgi:hypothetical protein
MCVFVEYLSLPRAAGVGRSAVDPKFEGHEPHVTMGQRSVLVAAAALHRFD